MIKNNFQPLFKLQITVFLYLNKSLQRVPHIVKRDGRWTTTPSLYL